MSMETYVYSELLKNTVIIYITWLPTLMRNIPLRLCQLPMPFTERRQKKLIVNQTEQSHNQFLTKVKSLFFRLLTNTQRTSNNINVGLCGVSCTLEANKFVCLATSVKIHVYNQNKHSNILRFIFSDFHAVLNYWKR